MPAESLRASSAVGNAGPPPPGTVRRMSQRKWKVDALAALPQSVRQSLRCLQPTPAAAAFDLYLLRPPHRAAPGRSRPRGLRSSLLPPVSQCRVGCLYSRGRLLRKGARPNLAEQKRKVGQRPVHQAADPVPERQLGTSGHGTWRRMLDSAIVSQPAQLVQAVISGECRLAGQKYARLSDVVRAAHVGGSGRAAANQQVHRDEIRQAGAAASHQAALWLPALPPRRHREAAAAGRR